MWSRISRLSRAQLVLLLWFVQHPDSYGSVATLSKATKLSGKGLGGVISSLSRSNYRGEPLILPWGRAVKGSGLRWRLNSKLNSLKDAKGEVERLLLTYRG